MEGQDQLCFRYLLMVLGLLQSLFVNYILCSCSASESRALLTLKGEDNSNALWTWNRGSDCCDSWVGVTCDASKNNVIAVKLTGSLVLDAGVLSASLCDLHKLQVLEISGSTFMSLEEISLITCLRTLTDFRYLGIAELSPSISIPPQLCNLKNLTHLDVHRNRLHEDLPGCIWEMTNLEYLDLADLSLVGEYSDMADLGLPEALPPEVCNLKNLTYISLEKTFKLAGYLPACIWQLTKLEHLDLGSLPLQGTLSPQICDLKNLGHLALGSINLAGILPACIWNMTKLEHLDLGSTKLQGYFSSQMCNLQKLTYLSIAQSSSTGVLPACIWNLKSLKILDFAEVDLSTMQVPVGGITAPLRELYLASTSVYDAVLDVAANLTDMRALDISKNRLTALPKWIQNSSQLVSLHATDNLIRTIPPWIGSLKRLEDLDVSRNAIGELGSFPPFLLELDASHNQIQNISDSIGALSKLTDLSLSGNSISDVSILSVLFSLSELRYLDLSFNLFTEIPLSFSYLTHLESLDLSSNPIKRVPGLCGMWSLKSLTLSDISLNNSQDMEAALACLQNFSQLQSFELARSQISGDLSTIIPGNLYNLSQLEYLDISSNNITGDLSTFSEGLPALSQLDVSNNHLRSTIPDDFPVLQYLDVSNNFLSGELPTSHYHSNASIRGVMLVQTVVVLESFYFNFSRNQLGGHVSEFHWGDVDATLDLSSNRFEGQLPPFALTTFSALVLSRNNFTGLIPDGLNNSVDLTLLDLSFNRLSGTIPVSLGELSSLKVLDLSSNQLTGTLLPHLGNCTMLGRLRVGNNALSGEIPDSIGRIGGSLRSLSLRQNNLEGQIPTSLGNCTNLEVLDLSANNLDGILPSTLQKLNASLRVLIVASNHISGQFPAWIITSNFTSLQVLDLSRNSFHGYLPAAYSQLSGFITGTNTNDNGTLYEDGIQIQTKGQDLTFTYLVTVETSFDVSHNQFSGHIPDGLGELAALWHLGLQHNNFSGTIPTSLSKLSKLESLELSSNSLLGRIPSELGLIYTLEYFDVSNNFLSGPIPEGQQFRTFNESSFANNSGLCGPPLRACHDGAETPIPTLSPEGNTVSWRQKISNLVSWKAFLIGFGPSFATVVSIFALSERARYLLWVPKRKVRNVYVYTKPYGAYVPKS